MENKLQDRGGVMAKYKITLSDLYAIDVEVEADSLEQAELIALDYEHEENVKLIEKTKFERYIEESEESEIE